MSPRRIGLLLATGVLVAAAAYTLVYLYRWEWHRALIAGMFLLVVELGIGIALVLDRIARLEAKLDARQRDELAATRATLREAEAPAREPFAWLSDSTNRMSVFVPLLLGAGVVLSALAWVVERVARLTARPTLERGLALRLQPLTVGIGELSTGDRRPLPFSPLGSCRGTGRRVAIAIGAVVAAALLGAGVDKLGDASQNRPDALVRGSAGRVVLQVDNKAAPGADVAAARNLWAACSNQIGTAYRLTGVEQLGDGRVELRVRPAVGKYAERRLRGCMNDATIPLVRASVLEVSAR
jgi:hypothetical protein